MGTWSFRARKGGNYARTCVRARAAAGGGRPEPEPEPGSGLGLGSLPGLVLFEPGVAGMGYSTTRTKPAPLRYPNPLRSATRSAPAHPPTGVCERIRTARTVERLRRFCRTVATVDFWRTRMPSRSAINSAPDFHSLTHQLNREIIALSFSTVLT